MTSTSPNLPLATDPGIILISQGCEENGSFEHLVEKYRKLRPDPRG